MTTAHTDFQKGMRAHAYFKLDDQAMSEDLVQDAFTKTWRYLARGGKIDVMKAFLYHVLNNLIVDEYRRHASTSLDALLEKGYEPGVNDTDRLVDALDGKGALLLIQRLPETYRTVMRMRYVEDLTIAEIALATGQSKNGIAVIAHRGLAKLKVLYNA